MSAKKITFHVFRQYNILGRLLVRERNMNRWRWVLTGAVQGVGFRPFVYRTARATGVTGQVANTSSGVVVEIQNGSDRKSVV